MGKWNKVNKSINTWIFLNLTMQSEVLIQIRDMLGSSFRTHARIVFLCWDDPLYLQRLTTFQCLNIGKSRLLTIQYTIFAPRSSHQYVMIPENIMIVNTFAPQNSFDWGSSLIHGHLYISSNILTICACWGLGT